MCWQIKEHCLRTKLPFSAKIFSDSLCRCQRFFMWIDIKYSIVFYSRRLGGLYWSFWLCVCSQHSLHNGNFTTTTVAPKFMRLLRLFVSNENTREKRICIHLTFCGNSKCKISTKEENLGSLGGFIQ